MNKFCEICSSCVEKRKNPARLRPYSLEYLALKTVLQKCIQEKTIDKCSDFITRELCRNKWYRWCFFLPRNHLTFHVNEIISITSEENEDNRRKFFENEVIRSYCLFCYSHECVICRWRRPPLRYGMISKSSQGHHFHCEEKY